MNHLVTFSVSKTDFTCRLRQSKGILSLFRVLRLISASPDRIGYITNFSSMIELLHDLKNSSF